ncbi:MAG: hypothetical protein GXP44_02060 [bacterium]|nr:hypothetical protein [bacterium]
MELSFPYYRIFLENKKDEISKECLAYFIGRETENKRGTEVATTVVARSLALYKKYKNLFLYERGEDKSDFWLAMLGVRFKIDEKSGENGFFVPPSPEKEMDFLFIRESDPTFSYEAKDWNMYFKSFKDHLPMVFE